MTGVWHLNCRKSGESLSKNCKHTTAVHGRSMIRQQGTKSDRRWEKNWNEISIRRLKWRATSSSGRCSTDQVPLTTTDQSLSSVIVLFKSHASRQNTTSLRYLISSWDVPASDPRSTAHAAGPRRAFNSTLPTRCLSVCLSAFSSVLSWMSRLKSC